MHGQVIRDNTTGVTGTGILGPDNLDDANLIYRNTTGVDFTGTIQFNRIDANVTGVKAKGNSQIAHNQFADNRSVGILVNNVTDVQIANNTMYAATGDNIRIENLAKEIEVRGNTLWVDPGTNIFVADNARSGFFSDYNQLHATGTGKLVHWMRDFTDILDWQVDVNLYDLHSIGTTVVNPLRAQPAFVSMARGDYRRRTLSAACARPVPAWTRPIHATMWCPAVVGESADQSQLRVGHHRLDHQRARDGRRSQRHSVPWRGVFCARQRGHRSCRTDDQSVDQRFHDDAARFAEPGCPVRRPCAIEVRIAHRYGNDQDRVQERRRHNPISADATARPTSATAGTWQVIGWRSPWGRDRSRIALRRSVPPARPMTLIWITPSCTCNPRRFHPTMGRMATRTPSPVVPATHLALTYPDLYVDWQRDVAKTIRWQSIGNNTNSPVRIDLMQDGAHGPQLVTTIAASTPDNGEFIVIPANLGVNFDTPGLRIQIALANDPITIDRGQESFTVPNNSLTFFVDDASNTNDEYTLRRNRLEQEYREDRQCAEASPGKPVAGVRCSLGSDHLRRYGRRIRSSMRSGYRARSIWVWD